ncbi:MAG: cobalamin-dependent protein [Pseudomonadota bacterium]
MMSNLTELAQSLVDLNEEKVLTLVKQKIENREDPIKIIQECNAGMVEIGMRFESNDYFISELVMSSEILKKAMADLEPLMGDEEKGPTKGTVVIGTVKDDIHDIGKNIVVTLLKGVGYEVVDLGTDVPAEKFVNTVKETGASVLGLSALLNFTFPRMKEVIEALKDAGIRDKVTVIIGGAPCNEEVRKSVGADHFAIDATKGVRVCQEVYGQERLKA